MDRLKFLKKIYLVSICLIFLLIIFTPILIKGGSSFIVDEELLESIIVAVLFGIGYFIYRLYEKQTQKDKKELVKLNRDKKTLEERLEEAFRYIGTVNIQIQEVKSILSSIEQYPEKQSDIKYVFEYLGYKILSIVDADWALLRVVDLTKEKTLKEFCAIRNRTAAPKNKISNNKELIENKPKGKYLILKSAQINLGIKAFCVLSSERINDDQIDLIKAITNQLEMLFIIFTSLYYKNSHSDNNVSNKKA